MTRPTEDHTCFGCQKPIGDNQPHIHVGLDDFGQREGFVPLGLGGDDFMFPFCEPCTVDAKNGWQLEAHKITPERP